MKIILMGYGKMGREIEKIAQSRGHQIVLRVDKDNASQISKENLKQGDAVIEFSTPHTVLENIYRVFDAGLPVVVGTTGWYDRFDEIEAKRKELNGTLFYASNFSLGVNLFFRLNRQLAEMMNAYPQYDVSMEEIHHIHKLDKPSGTAITLAKDIISNIGRKDSWSITESGEKILHIRDVREGEVPGTHIIRYTSAIDDIEIMHRAHNRQGFALGAVLAAEFVKENKGLLTMEDLMGQNDRK